jgi:dihydroorotate dehydrogenase
LRRATYRGVRGVSIGKNADTPITEAARDYRECLERLYAVADYFAVNVSSPNTARLRELQDTSALSGLLDSLQEERLRLEATHGRRVPLLVKVSPDLEDDDLIAFSRTVQRSAIDGVIATNTSTGIPELATDLARVGGGGISGDPLGKRSLATLRALRAELGVGMPIISVGGVMSGDHVLERLRAGATLVQVYTGFVYRGLELLDEIHDAVAR